MCGYCWGHYDPGEFEGRPLPNSNAPILAGEGI